MADLTAGTGASGAKQRSLSAGRRMDKFVTYLLLVIFSVLFILPFVWLLGTSLKEESEAITFPPTLVPHTLDWKNYAEVFDYVPFALFYRNTIFITFMTVLGTVLSSSVVAYGFARIDGKGRNFWFLILLGTMMLPGQVTMIPVYLIFTKLNWINTFLPLIVPSFLGSAFFVFLLRQFFLSIPKDLEEAAYMDGANIFGIFARIIIPLSVPALTSVAILSFMWAWNDFMGPLIYLNDQSKFTLALGIQFFNGSQNMLWGPMMAASTMVIAPLIVMFFFMQRFFIEGIVTSGIKG